VTGGWLRAAGAQAIVRPRPLFGRFWPAQRVPAALERRSPGPLNFTVGTSQ